MTRIIAAALIILAIYGVWEGWVMWDKYDHDQDLIKKQEAAEQNPDVLSGLPENLQKSYQNAKGSTKMMRAWLRYNGDKLEDPRRAWIELDFMVMIAREDPVEAKQIFADIKARTPETSPVYHRIKKLEKTYQ